MTNQEPENNKEFENEMDANSAQDLPLDEGAEVTSEDLSPENLEAVLEEALKTEGSTEDKLKAEIAELNDKYLRLYSEFDNMKRRNAKERLELMQTAGKDILLSLLPVIDDFERAQKSFENVTDIAAMKQGVELIYNKFTNILNQRGVKPMDAVGKAFDVDFHEAITKIPAPSEDLKGKVVDEVEKGYILHDKVIRFAKVVIGE